MAFKGTATAEQWSAFIDILVAEHAGTPYVLLVIDPLAAFVAGTENDAGCMLRFLAPLQRLAARDLSVLLLHHPARGERQPGQAARGSGALCGSADILIEMHPCPGASVDDRRRLEAFSRFPETPRQLVIEWTADSTDYRSLGSFEDDDFTTNWQILHGILAEAPRKLDRDEIAQNWPTGTRPAPTTLRRWLDKAVAQGIILQDGPGVRQQPYRYWLPEREAVWRQDPLAIWHMPELFQEPEQGAPGS